MKVTITADYKKAVFTWNDAATECEMNAIGFEDSEIDSLIASKAHMGSQVSGYSVEVDF